MSFIGIILSVLALGFLIFIHELGHYVMARWVGMRVETFSIGFGKPMKLWKRDNGEVWQIGWLPFGGYVRIAGTEKGEKDPYEIKDGFFGKSPWDRIKVAFMGPFVNIVFAFLCFVLLYALGGRDYFFTSLNPIVGAVDTQSELYEKGVRPGDLVLAYEGVPYRSLQDHLMTPLLSEGDVTVTGEHVHYDKESTPFTYEVLPYPRVTQQGVLPSLGITSSANFLYYNPYRLPELDVPKGSPLEKSGLEAGDLLVWADGQVIYSLPQLTQMINEPTALLTVQRGNRAFLRKVPKIPLEEFRLSLAEREEFIDWQFETDLEKERLSSLYFIPYNLSLDNYVEFPLSFIEKEAELLYQPTDKNNPLFAPLQEGDKIVAVDGEPVTYAFELFKAIQEKKILMIVERDAVPFEPLSLEASLELFRNVHNPKNYEGLIASIGKAKGVRQEGSYVLLQPVVPVDRFAFPMSEEEKSRVKAELLARKESLEKLQEEHNLSKTSSPMQPPLEEQKFVGLTGVQDRPVAFNPSPWTLFGDAFGEIQKTLSALFFGQISPKHLSGPVGIVQVISNSLLTGINNGLWWLGMISLNLAVLNLLPLPVLDGGSICISFYQMVTGKRLSLRTLEMLIIPFAVLLIVAIIWFTYNDILRIVTGRVF